jgi:1,4-dihydroxy-2-naphthoate octaprenyltransferase
VLVLVLAWGYSAPPLRLCARGLGEITTAVVVAVLVPWLGFYVQAPAGGGGAQLAWSVVAPALLQMAMLLAIEFPDAAGDAATGKRTLVVRLGAARAAPLYVALTTAAFAWFPAAWALGLPARVAFAGLAPLPVALWRIARAGEHRERAAYERLTFAAVALLIATSIAELAAWLA